MQQQPPSLSPCWLAAKFFSESMPCDGSISSCGPAECAVLTRNTIETYFVPVREKLLKYLDELPEPKFKNEKYDSISQGVRALKDLERSRGVVFVAINRLFNIRKAWKLPLVFAVSMEN
jgi:hypothetical protein